MTVSYFIEQAVEAAKSQSVARIARLSLSPSLRAQIARRAALYDAYVAPGETVFDIGVGDGLQSEVFLACHFNVIAIERNPSLRASIIRQFGRDPRFQLVAKKLGTKTGLEEVDEPISKSTGRVQALWHNLLRKDEPLTRKLVEVTTLDAVIGQFGRPRVCRINTAGSEAEVLSGLSQPIPFITFALDLDRPNVISACLDRLSSIAPIRVNLNSADSETMLYPRWLTATAFLKSVEENDVMAKADCWVATEFKDL